MAGPPVWGLMFLVVLAEICPAAFVQRVSAPSLSPCILGDMVCVDRKQEQFLFSSAIDLTHIPAHNKATSESQVPLGVLGERISHATACSAEVESLNHPSSLMAA